MTAGPGVISRTNPAAKNTPRVAGLGTIGILRSTHLANGRIAALAIVRLEAGARQHRQRRVLRKACIRERQPAAVERRACRTDDVRVTALGAQPDSRVDEVVAGGHRVTIIRTYEKGRTRTRRGDLGGDVDRRAGVAGLRRRP